MKGLLALDKAHLIADLALEIKGEDIIIIDTKENSSIADFIILISANSSRKLKAVADNIQKKLSKKKIKSLNIQGTGQANWMILDYEDVIVHIFHKDTRKFYDIEQLWSSAIIKEIKEDVR